MLYTHIMTYVTLQCRVCVCVCVYVCVCVCGGNIIFTTHGIHPLLEVWVFGCRTCTIILDYLFV